MALQNWMGWRKIDCKEGWGEYWPHPSLTITNHARKCMVFIILLLKWRNRGVSSSISYTFLSSFLEWWDSDAVQMIFVVRIGNGYGISPNWCNHSKTSWLSWVWNYDSPLIRYSILGRIPPLGLYPYRLYESSYDDEGVDNLILPITQCPREIDHFLDVTGSESTDQVFECFWCGLVGVFVIEVH